MHYACIWRFRDIAVYLAKEAGARVAVQNKYNRTPLARTSDEIKSLLAGTGLICIVIMHLQKEIVVYGICR